MAGLNISPLHCGFPKSSYPDPWGSSPHKEERTAYNDKSTSYNDDKQSTAYNKKSSAYDMKGTAYKVKHTAYNENTLHVINEVDIRQRWRFIQNQPLSITDTQITF